MAVSGPDLSRGVSWAGLALGPFAWGSTLQANYAFADWQCAHGFSVTPWISVAGLLLAALGAGLSYRAMRAVDAGPPPPRTLDTRRFLATIGLYAALIFLVINGLQGVASLIFTGCER
jgi:hypothetical protein